MTSSPAASAPPVRPGETFNRDEVKYFLPTRQVPELVAEFADYIRADPHSLGEWGYPISSVYWDTADFQFFWEKVEGVKFRRKLRFRRYGASAAQHGPIRCQRWIQPDVQQLREATYALIDQLFGRFVQSCLGIRNFVAEEFL